jgi:hypothetical protein
MWWFSTRRVTPQRFLFPMSTKHTVVMLLFSGRTQVVFNVRIPDNTTAIHLMIRLSGNATATWWVTGVRYVLLDTAMRNIARTNATDFELCHPESGARYVLGNDYEVSAD